jgi:ADP-ribosylglycohydrolase
MKQTESQYTGCLVGGAIGDAIGGAVEFKTWKLIKKIYGPKGINRYAQAYGRTGAITDDTQMTLFTAEGLLKAKSAKKARLPQVWHGYQRWYRSQRAQLPKDFSKEPGLLQHPFLWESRAPGGTCMSALGWWSSPGSILRPPNNSKGCGGVMRVAPVGLALEDPYELGCETAALTHGHVDGWAPAGALAVIIARVSEGAALEQAVDEAIRFLPRGSRTRFLLCKAVEFADWPPSSGGVLNRLGQGWTGDEALAIGAYCALTATSFLDGVLRAVNHSGDSDSTGSIAGQILGARDGIESIPDYFIRGLEGADVIQDMAFQMYAAFAR